MGHAHDARLKAKASSFVQKRCEHGDKGLSPLQREALLPNITSVDERLKKLSLGQVA
jgi:hypothetical protein